MPEVGSFSTQSIPVEDFLVELMNINSSSKNEGNLAKALVEYFEKTGWCVHQQPIRTDSSRANLLITKKPFQAPGPKYLLNTHLDTVPPFIAPKNNGKEITGRGANDAKGQMAAMIFAAQRIAKEEPKLAENLGLLLVVGEEVDHIGMTEASSLKLVPEYLVVGEPTELKFARIQKGAFKARSDLGFPEKVVLKVTGKAAHSGYPELGESAIEKLLDVLQDIRTYEWPNSEDLGATTVNIGLISGGQALNALAANASASLFFRVTTSTSDLYGRLKKIVAGRAEIDLSLGKNEPVHLNIPPLDMETSVVSFNTDLPYFIEKDKLKGAYLFGAGNIQNAHSDNEFILIKDLRKAVDVHVNLFKKLMTSN